MSHCLLWPGRAGPGLGSRAMSKSEERVREWAELRGQREGGRDGGVQEEGPSARGLLLASWAGPSLFLSS